MSTPWQRASRPAAAAGDAAPLSWQQEQIWLHGQWAAPAPLYQETVLVSRPGGWDEAPLRAALAAWQARYSLLRTVFPLVGGEARQVAGGADAFALEITQAGCQAEARQAAAADGRAAMDLQHGPLVRARWGRWPGGQELYLALHHLIFDGYTLQQLWLPEWAADYEALAAGGALPLRPPVPAYGDYARWQRGSGNYAAAERAEEHRDFWRRHFAGEWPRLRMGGDPGAEPHAADSNPFALDARRVGALMELARTARATPFMVLLAGFAALLHRLSGQPAVVIGAPAAGRGQRRWERLAGPMVNTLALRLNLEGNPAFAAVVQQARDAVLEALGHQEYPFALAMRVAARAAASPEPEVEAYLSLLPPGDAPPAGWAASHLAIDNGLAKFPLHLDLAWDHQGAIAGRCRYQPARVDAALGPGLAESWMVLLAAAAQDPAARIGALPLLSENQRRRMVAIGRGPQPPLPAGTLAEMFARQAAATPDRVALVALSPSPPEAAATADGSADSSPDGCADGSAAATAPFRREISYSDLRAEVEQIAAGLRAAGVQPGETVGLALPRSAEAVTGMLALVWYGAAYLPLHADDPPARRQQQLDLAGVRWVIAAADSSSATASPAGQGHRPAPVTLSLGALRAAGASVRLPPAGPELAAVPACVMFTSGSTGEPRAVRIPQRGVIRLARPSGYADLGPEETFLHLAPLSFDAATFEIWAPLLNAGRLVIPPAGLPSVAQLGAWIRQERITTLWLTATLFNALVDTDPLVLAPLRQLLAGGEALSPRHVRQAQRVAPQVALLNGYGPTENTTFTCVHRIPPGAEQDSIPLGRPIAHATAYVVDAYGALAPEGAEGELWVGGEGLAGDYLGGDPEGRFVRPEWAAGERLFRSGDRARWTRTGGELVLAFLGRHDQQVKLRGMRLELGGIETLLLRHPRVRQAAVTVEGEGDRRELTAYAATEAGRQELSDWLARELPAAMIPARWILCPELPRLASGKLDRQGLRALLDNRRPAARAAEPGRPLLRACSANGRSGRIHATSPHAPLSRTELRLQAIWGELLGRDAIGREDDFYARGGHSLIALRMVARIETAFGCSLPPAWLAAHRSIAAQATWIEARSIAAGRRPGGMEKAGDNPRWAPLQAGEPQLRPRFFSVEAGGRFLCLAEAMGPEQPWSGLRLASLAALPHPCSMAAVAAYHGETLRRLQPRGPYFLAGWCQNGVVAFELACQLLAAGEQVACLALMDVVSPAFLQRVARLRWPVFRARYAWCQWRQRARLAAGPEAGPEPRERDNDAPPAMTMAWRRWQYRWRRPNDPPRTGEPAALVQHALRHYRPQPFPGRILLFRSEYQVLASLNMGRFYQPDMGWEELAGGGLEVHQIAGDHRTMFAPPGVGQMARVLDEMVTAPAVVPALRSLELEAGR